MHGRRGAWSGGMAGGGGHGWGPTMALDHTKLHNENFGAESCLLEDRVLLLSEV